jgi:hypothetical protein
MKRWAILTVLLYAVALIMLTVPAIWIAFNGWSDKDVSLQNMLKMYLRWGYWLWLAVLAAGQALLLLLPINIAERRLPTRRPLKTPVIVTAFFLANLCFAGLVSILCLYFQEDGANFFGYFLPFKPNQVSPSDFETEFGAVITGLAFWFVWAVIFRSFAKSDDPDALLKRSTRWLLRGSILELLGPFPVTSSCAAATIAARPPARSGALPPASPSCCSASAQVFSFCSSNAANGCNPNHRTPPAGRCKNNFRFPFARRSLICADANGLKTVQHAVALNSGVRAARSPQSRHVLLRADGL